jgi:hypothetical protein
MEKNGDGAGGGKYFMEGGIKLTYSCKKFVPIKR